MASTSHATEHDTQWSDLAVKNSVGPHVARAQAILTGSEEALESLGAVAALLRVAGEDDKLQQLRQATTEMLQAREMMRLHRDALTHLATPAGYQPTGATTDFASAFGAKSAELSASQPYDIAQDPLMLSFEEAAAQDAGGAREEQIDDDIAIEGGGGMELGKNTQCPISGKPLLELEDPVADAVGFVYERAAILDYLQRKGGHAACPVAGTMHHIAAAELRPARAVLAAKKRGAAGRRVCVGRREAQGVVELD